MIEIKSESIPIKLWSDEIDEGAIQQAKNLANLKEAFHHIAIMPDYHQGYGMPIGGVMALKDAVIPNAVGVDIGCGVCALKTDLKNIPRRQLSKIIHEIRQRVPTGFNWHKKSVARNLMPNTAFPTGGIIEKEFSNAQKQLGTLGGGNHFIEVQKGSDQYIWIMIHSGSRNLGKTVADHYNKLAISLNKKRSLPTPEKWQLASLPKEDEVFHLYFKEMKYCIDFAFNNRQQMMKNIQMAFSEVIDVQFDLSSFINIAHNFAEIENHFKEEVVIHRKGATQAFKGQKGIIPGSQGAPSYIVEGKGNPESFQSCSHGAGRKLGRRQAIRELDFLKERKSLENQGILHSLIKPKDLDEAPGAYKNIHHVLKNQQDLINPLIELQPLAVIKG